MIWQRKKSHKIKRRRSKYELNALKCLSAVFYMRGMLKIFQKTKTTAKHCF